MDLDDLMDKIYTAYEEAGAEPNIPVTVDGREIVAVELNHDTTGNASVNLRLQEAPVDG